MFDCRPSIPPARTSTTANLARVEDWYARRHAPDLIRAGLLHARRSTTRRSGRRGSATSTRSPGPELFTTQAYRDVAAKDTEGPGGDRPPHQPLEHDLRPGADGERADGDADWADGGPSRRRDGLGPVHGALRPARSGRGRAPRVVPDAGVPAPPGPARDSARAGSAGKARPIRSRASRDPRWFVINEWEGVMAAMADGTAKEALGPARRRARPTAWAASPTTWVAGTSQLARGRPGG